MNNTGSAFVKAEDVVLGAAVRQVPVRAPIGHQLGPPAERDGVQVVGSPAVSDQVSGSAPSLVLHAKMIADDTWSGRPWRISAASASSETVRKKHHFAIYLANTTVASYLEAPPAPVFVSWWHT